MPLTITTWNINSVRLRIDLVTRFLAEHQPDVLCLQETKCPDAEFPLGPLAKLGYRHAIYRGMKGYNGVAILSRLPLHHVDGLDMCGKQDCRHVAASLMPADGKPVTIHNFYIPAGGDEPDRDINPKFGHKLDFVAELADWSERMRAGNDRAILVGDLNIAPLEFDVWSHKALLKVVSHTPVETEGLTAALRRGGWIDAVRQLVPEPERIYTWWSYRAMSNWEASDRGRRLDHIWVGPGLADRIASHAILKAARGWDKPSDHVPLSLTLNLPLPD